MRPATVNVRDLDRFPSGTAVNAERLSQAGLVTSPVGPIKILGDGFLTRDLHVVADAFSASAKQKIDAAGGSSYKLPRPDAVSRRYRRRRWKSRRTPMIISELTSPGAGLVKFKHAPAWSLKHEQGRYVCSFDELGIVTEANDPDAAVLTGVKRIRDLAVQLFATTPSRLEPADRALREKLLEYVDVERSNLFELEGKEHWLVGRIVNVDGARAFQRMDSTHERIQLKTGLRPPPVGSMVLGLVRLNGVGAVHSQIEALRLVPDSSEASGAPL